jgi:hypothetical protein
MTIGSISEPRDHKLYTPNPKPIGMTIGSISDPRDHKLYTPNPEHQTTRQHDASLHHISSYILFRYARLGWSPSCRGSSPEQIEQLLAPLFDAAEQVESWV